jgi:hypothetical protein
MRGRTALTPDQKAERALDRCREVWPTNGKKDIGICKQYHRPYPLMKIDGERIVSILRWLLIKQLGLGRAWLVNTYNRNVLHKCGNPLCINPAHAYFGNVIANVGDRITDGRQWTKLSRTQAGLVWTKYYIQGLGVQEILKDRRLYCHMNGASHPAKKAPLNFMTIYRYIAGAQKALTGTRANWFAKRGMVDPSQRS